MIELHKIFPVSQHYQDKGTQRICPLQPQQQ